MTPEQCREARELLGWHRLRLSLQAGLSRQAVLDFETRRWNSRSTTVTAIRAALEAAGVEFTNSEAPGVRLRKGGSA